MTKFRTPQPTFENVLKEAATYSTPKYFHPLDFPKESPLHDDFKKFGYEYVTTKKRTISSADGVEYTYVYKATDSADQAKLGKQLISKYKMKENKKGTPGWSSDVFSNRIKYVGQIYIVDGTLEQYLSG